MMILENKNIEESQKEEIVTCVLETIATTFSKEVDVDFLSDCSIKSLNHNIGKLFTDIHSFDDWIERKEGILDVILNHDF